MLLMQFGCVPPVHASPNYEDFTTYTEVDPNNHITVTATQIHCDDAHNGEDAYVYLQRAVDHFSGNFTHKVDARWIPNPLDYPEMGFWALTNDIDDLKGLEDNNKNFLAAYFSGQSFMILEEGYSGSTYNVNTTISTSTTYYLLIKRANTSFTCKVYTNQTERDNEGTPDVATLSLTLHAVVSYRYVFGGLTYNSAQSGDVYDAYVYNLDLGYTYSYILYGLYDEEDGTHTGAVNVTAYYTTLTPETFEVDGRYVYGSKYKPQYFRFDLTIDREYWLSSGETSATIYIFNDTTTEYRFEFLDLSGALQDYPNVRAEFYVNTTLHTIEKRGVDIEDKVMFSLVNGRRYKISIEDTTVGYTFGDLLMTDTTTVSLTLKGIEFPQNVILAYRYVRLYAERHNNYSSISMLYQDTQNDTDNVVCNIKYQNGTTAYTTTQYTASFNVTWTSANYSLTYYVEMDATHDDYGELNYRAIMYRGGFNTSPWGIDWIGTIPGMQSSALIPIFLILAGAGLFSKVNAYVGAFIATILGIFFVWWGWLDIAPGLLITALVFSILMALGYKKRVVIGA